ncbi:MULTISPECIES: hypothetical protein [Sinorhizobium]|uniref:hypothetical protein n=1 Tax=Sinorhizobium TaxID=28105 RepID=UPI000BE9EC04|nr:MULTISPECIES: hypothetical protein [Sinorhizobium]MDW9782470.1 hypothetical protein [Sinorhizobium meliloti]PDT50952.1 hypothetical protein CO664_24725 [Sinorhizobium sp. NG07B]POH25067.1 hypothetical protein ATY30_28955 [Sinorhizobium americanum]
MISNITTTAKVLVPVLIAVGLAGCGTAAKEKTAPCKRPANLTSYAPDPRQECGPMMSVNGDAAAAVAAIEAMAAE